MRRTLAAALVAFLLGIAVGPVLGWERETALVMDYGNPNVLRSRTSAGWTVSRSDVATPEARLVTFERPRIVGDVMGSPLGETNRTRK